MVETEREQVSGAAAQSWSLLMTPRPIDIKKKKKCSAAAAHSLLFLGL